MVEPAGVGIREQRKQQTRQRIAEVALALFVRRGFDVVTVAEVAQAAGVTEKTVFNHFGTKEDLVYGGDKTFEAALLESVRARPSRESVLDAVKRFLLDRYRRVGFDPDGRHRAGSIATIVAASPALQAHERQIHARYADALCDLITAERRAEADDIRPRVAAEALLVVHRASLAVMRHAILAGVPDGDVAERTITAARSGFDLLARGMGHYAR